MSAPRSKPITKTERGRFLAVRSFGNKWTLFDTVSKQKLFAEQPNKASIEAVTAEMNRMDGEQQLTTETIPLKSLATKLLANYLATQTGQ